MNRKSQKKLWETTWGNERRNYNNDRSVWKSPDYNEHISRYVFASCFIKNKITLDVACGTGYGSRYLVRHRPQIVVGMDISKKAIKEGKSSFKNERLEMLIGDATNIGFKDNSFDAITSFETLEHLHNYERFLDEIKRVLNEDGIFIISTPNYDAFSGYDNFYINEFHVKEFTLPEFCSLLQRYFKKVDLYGESPMGIIYKTLRNIRRILFERIKVDLMRLYIFAGWFTSRFDKSGSIYPLRSTREAMPKFLIAVCHNRR